MFQIKNRVIQPLNIAQRGKQTNKSEIWTMNKQMDWMRVIGNNDYT